MDELLLAEVQMNDDELSEQMKLWAEEYKLAYLLSFHDDGVIWGRYENEEWLFSSAKFGDVSPLFRVLTLQQVRLFGKQAEIVVTPMNGRLVARLLNELADQSCDCYDEEHLLWGTQGEVEDQFTLLREGQQGLLHIVPMKMKKVAQKNRAKLKVRHYIDYTEDHRAYVKYSRLVDLVGGN